MELTTLDDQRQFFLRGLVDSGCTGSSIDSGFVNAKGLNAQPLPRPIPVYNADGTLNNGGLITHTITLRMVIGKHSERITLGVTNLGKSDLFLGHEWLRHHNPSIDWQSGSLKFNCCPVQCRQLHLPSEPEDEEEPAQDVEGFPTGEVVEGDRIFAFDFYGYRMADEHHVRAHTTMAQQLAEDALKEKGVKSFEEQVPSCYHDFANIFSKESFDSLLECCPWDHAVELTPGSHTIDCKIYNLSLEEQRELDSFLEETCDQVVFALQNHPLLLHSSLLRRKMAGFVPYKTIAS